MNDFLIFEFFFNKKYWEVGDKTEKFPKEHNFDKCSNLHHY